MSSHSVHFIGSNEFLIRKLLTACGVEGKTLTNVINVVWNRKNASFNIRAAANRQIQEEVRFEGTTYFSIGNIIDLIAQSAHKQSVHPASSSEDDSAVNIILPFVKDIKEATEILVRYRKSLIILVDDVAKKQGEVYNCTLCLLQQLRIPHYHLSVQENDVSVQADIIRLAIHSGKLPSPLASLKYYELVSPKSKKKTNEDLDNFFDTFNLPFFWNQKKNEADTTGVKSLRISETEIIQSIESSTRDQSRRFLSRRGHLDDLFLVEFDRCIPSSTAIRILQNGILIQGVKHSFLGCSSSGLKKRKAFVIKGCEKVASAERQKYGDFQSLTTASKQISRFSLLLTNVALSDVIPKYIEEESDVEVNKFCFTDGCGKISLDMAEALFRQTKMSLRRQNESSEFQPSVFQIRMQGMKGIVVLDSKLPPGTLVVRPSMKKFHTKIFPQICVCDYSRPYAFGHLNRQYIMLLSALGVPDETFLSIQREYFDRIKGLTQNYNSALHILEWRNRSFELIQEDELDLSKLRQLQNHLTEEAPKLKILIPESRTIFGVAESPRYCPETGNRLEGILKYGECLVRVTMKGGQQISLQNQRVVVSKNPCYLLGDVRILTAVSSLQRPELAFLERDLIDCIIFPIEGIAPHSVEIAGSDLDGDKYFVCWDARLVPPQPDAPYSYPGFEARKTLSKPRQLDLIKYFCSQNTVTDLTGRVDSNFRAWANIKGPSSDECIRLGQLFSRVVDSAKSGESVKLDDKLRVPKESRPIPSADSKFVWQKMEYIATMFAEGQLMTGNFNIVCSNESDEKCADGTEDENNEYVDEDPTEDSNLFYDLVTRNHLAMSEFTKFRLIMQYLNEDIDMFFLSRFASCVDFGRLNEYEIGYVIHSYSVPEAILSNQLKYYSRILSNHAEFLKKYLAKDKVPWKLYWRSETVGSTLYYIDVLMHALRKNTDAMLILKLPDSVAIALRFSIPFQELNTTRKAIFFTGESDCTDKPIQGFIDLSSFFLSRHFGYAEEYTLKDEKYRISIDVSEQKTLQIYRGQKGATFVNLRIDNLVNGGDKKVQLSADLTRFNRRVLEGTRRHPLVRKSPVFDIELFVSNRTSPYAREPRKISFADVLLEDRDIWLNSNPPPYQEQIKSNSGDFEFDLNQSERVAEMLTSIRDKFMSAGSAPYSDMDMMMCFLETILYPSHTLLSMSDQICAELQENITTLAMKFIFGTISDVDIDVGDKLHIIVNAISILSDLGIEISAHSMPILGQVDVPTFLHHLIEIIRRWDTWLRMSPPKRRVVLHWLDSMVGELEDPIFEFVRRNIREQADILLHELKDGTEEIRSSSSASRIVNLRIDPSVSDFGCNRREEDVDVSDKMPTVTLYSVQVMPVALRFARGEHVCVLKQPSDSTRLIGNGDEYLGFSDAYEEEFPSLSITKDTGYQQKKTEFLSKEGGLCLGRVVSVTDAPFSIKVKLLPPSHAAKASDVPAHIEECLKLKKDIYFELRVIPANVIAHERIVDSIELILSPKVDHNLFFGHDLCQSIMRYPIKNDDLPTTVDFIEISHSTRASTRLNSRQQEALMKSTTNIISLVHGPPGTGKTTTIIEIIKELLNTSNDRILVSAETNLAVDNLALKMLQDNGDYSGQLIRIGSGEKVDEKLKSIHLEAMVKGRIPKHSAHLGEAEKDFYLSRHKKIMNEIFGGIRVLFATTIGAGDPIINGQKFDFVIMDEASMSTEPSCLPALSHGCSRLVLVGDHKQLGPHACQSKCVSFFERLLSDSESETNSVVAVTMLNQQHRMHSKLCNFPSKTFYESKLLTANGLDKARTIPNVVFGRRTPLKFLAVKDGKEQRMKTGSWYNEIEVGMVLSVIRDLTNSTGKDNIKGGDISILTPYRAQQVRIQLQLKSTWKNADPPPEVFSIDGYQGRENEIIVYSAVRCGSSLGFSDDERRINVLLTRAKRGLIVLGDRVTLTKSKIWKEWIGEAETS